MRVCALPLVLAAKSMHETKAVKFRDGGKAALLHCGESSAGLAAVAGGGWDNLVWVQLSVRFLGSPSTLATARKPT